MTKKRKRSTTPDSLGGAKRLRSHRRRTMILSIIAAVSMLALMGAGLLAAAANH